jgi:CheY-like chemotaxis protein
VAGRFAAAPLSLSALLRSWTGCIPVARASGAAAALPEKAASEFAEIIGGSVRGKDYHVVNITHSTPFPKPMRKVHDHTASPRRARIEVHTFLSTETASHEPSRTLRRVMRRKASEGENASRAVGTDLLDGIDRTMCILLVEDEALIRLILAEELTEAGFEVRAVAGGGQALAEVAAEADRLTLLVTDIHMPGSVDGTEVARQLRVRRPDIPVIYTTGRPDALNDLGSLGKRDILLAKPFTPLELISAARRLLDPARSSP